MGKGTGYMTDRSIISGESIKNAVVNRLLKCLPNVNIYKESTNSPLFPHCVVNQQMVTCEEERHDYFFLTYNMLVMYRHSADLSTELQLQKELDGVGLILLREFDVIPLDNISYIRCREKRIEKENGILYFFFDVRVLVNVIELEEIAKMEKIEYTIHVKE